MPLGNFQYMGGTHPLPEMDEAGKVLARKKESTTPKQPKQETVYPDKPTPPPLTPEEVEEQKATDLTDEEQKQVDAARAEFEKSGGMQGMGMGGGGGGGSGGGDPDAVYARITRQEYQDYVTNFREFEEELINKATTDTSLIDYAREDAAFSEERTAGMAQRNLSRYGAQLTPAQQQEMQRSIGRGTTLGGIQSVADARIGQRDANQRLMADLINIGQGVNRTSLAQLGSAAQDATARKNAYKQARAGHKAATNQAIGGLASMAIMAAFMI
tara:strand:- start:15878 stop:16690 length:813 start_codon:yes stop_codon:yes gene_type:complete